ncbi:MAG: hypothetical protein V4596_10090 [Bdellovibrionota bacterium]
MKKLIYALFIAVSTAGSVAIAGHDGNGGFGIQCSQAVKASNGVIIPAGLHALDYWDANNAFGYTWELGAKNLPWQQKIMIAAQRMEKLNSHVARELKNIAQNPTGYISFTKDKVYCGNTKVAGEDVYQEVDIGSTVIPHACELVPIAKNIRGCDSLIFKLKQNIFINPRQFALLDEESKAAIVMHEYFYLSGRKDGTSEKARALVALVARADFEQIPAAELEEEYKKINIFGINILVQGIKFQTQTNIYLNNLEFRKRQDGSLEEALGLDLNEKIPVSINGTNLLLEGVQDYFVYRFSKNGKLRDYFVDQNFTYRLPNFENTNLTLNLKESRVSFSEDGSYIESISNVEPSKFSSAGYPIEMTNSSPMGLQCSPDSCSISGYEKNSRNSFEYYVDSIKVGPMTYTSAKLHLAKNGEFTVKPQNGLIISGKSYGDRYGTQIKYLLHRKLLVYSNTEVVKPDSFIRYLLDKNSKALSSYTEYFLDGKNFRGLVLLDENGKIECWSFLDYRKKKDRNTAIHFDQNENVTHIEKNKVCYGKPE